MPQDLIPQITAKLHKDKAAITDRTAHRLHKSKMRLEYMEKQWTEQNIVLRPTILPLSEQTTNRIVTLNIWKETGHGPQLVNSMMETDVNMNDQNTVYLNNLTSSKPILLLIEIHKTMHIKQHTKPHWYVTCHGCWRTEAGICNVMFIALFTENCRRWIFSVTNLIGWYIMVFSAMLDHTSVSTRSHNYHVQTGSKYVYYLTSKFTS